jgi:hypothetical protein
MTKEELVDVIERTEAQLKAIAETASTTVPNKDAYNEIASLLVALEAYYFMWATGKVQ